MSHLQTPSDVTLHPDTLAFLGREQTLLIDGEDVKAADGATFDTENPATGQVLCTLAAAQAPDIDRAVAAARGAFEAGWRDFDATERGVLLWRPALRLMSCRTKGWLTTQRGWDPT